MTTTPWTGLKPPPAFHDAPDLGRAPIPGTAPTGADPDGTPAFEAVMAEVGKLSQMESGAVNWTVVVSESATVLRDTCKDLRIAAYMARGLMEQDGPGGLLQGLTILSEIVSHHWDGCWPSKRRLRGRAAAFTWLVEKTAPALSNRFVDAGDGPTLRTLTEALEGLSAALDDCMGEASPDLSPLSLVVRDKLREAEPEQNESVPPGTAGTTAAPQAKPAVPSTAPSQPQTAAGTAERATTPSLTALPPLDTTSERVVKRVFTEAAAALRPDDTGNPVFYHMVRYATWRGISDPPPAGDGGRTQLAPVPADRVAQYEKMLAAGRFGDVIAGTEVSITRNPFWLSGQRLTDAALTGLGHTAAREAVRHEVRALVERLPSVLDLKFSDGTPFADPATRTWIETEVLPPDTVATPLCGGDTWQSMLDAVTAEARPDDRMDLFSRLDAALSAERDPRRRFLWGMALSRACLDAGQSALARAQLERLEQQFTALGLAAWEPSLGADLAAALAEAGGARHTASDTSQTLEEKD